MNEIELYFTRQNLLWNLGLYIMILILILSIGLFLYDIGSRIYWNIYVWRKGRRNKKDEK